MNDTEGIYKGLVDFWNRWKHKQIPKKELSKYLPLIADTLSGISAKFEDEKLPSKERVPSQESKQLAGFLNFSQTAANQLGDGHEELKRILETDMRRIGNLLDEADVFLREKDRFKTYPEVGSPNPEYEWLNKDKLSEACREMRNAAAGLQAYAKVLAIQVDSIKY